jgi:type II secretory pathway component PulK
MRRWNKLKRHTQHARLLAVFEHSVSASSGVKVVEGRAAEEEVEEAWRSTSTEAAAYVAKEARRGRVRKRYMLAGD